MHAFAPTASGASVVGAPKGPGLAGPSSPDVGVLARWYVVQTRSRQEKAVAEVVTASGGECFLPTLRRIRYYGHRKRTVELPVFSCYVFLKGFPFHAYQAIAAKRAARLIQVPDQQQFEQEIAQIRLALGAGADLGPYRYFTRGRRARVTSGPFMGLEGIVEDRLKQDRLILQVQAIGRALSLEIDVSLLEPLE
jgi:transcription antitermination factor NusG